MMNKSARKKNKLFFLVSSAILLVTLPLQACAPTDQAAPDIVKLSVHPYLSYAPMYIAYEEGYFAEENLDVELVTFESGSQDFPSLIQGDIDVAGVALHPGLFNAMIEDESVRIVSDRGYFEAGSCTYLGILASPAWIERVNTSPVETLMGARGSFDETNFEGYIIDIIASEVGVSLEDFVLTDLPPTAQLDAVSKDQVDFIASGEPWTTRLLDTGKVTVWKSAQEIVPEMQWGVIAFGPSLLEERPEVGVRFMRALLKGVQTYNEGKTERNLEILNEALGLDIELLQRACWPPMREGGMVNTDSIDAYQEWAFSRGLLEQVIPVDSYWDSSFIEEAGR